MAAVVEAAGADPIPAGAKSGFNKLFVMLPVMFLARKLDAEDPKVVHLLRLAYGSMQTLCVLVVLYTYSQASKSGAGGSKIVYVPAPTTPFAGPETRKKYTQVDYATHIVSTARSLVGSTLFGVVMTVGLHIYKGMAMGLAIQAVMGPLNLFENPLVKALLLGNGFRMEDKIFEEKDLSELNTEEEDVVDESGNTVSPLALKMTAKGGTVDNEDNDNNKDSKKKKKQPKKQSPSDAFDELLLDTWDMGNKADIAKLMSGLTAKNCNNQTKENGWTPLVILSGLDAPGTVSAMRQLISIGGNPAVTDKEGWNALHWAAFHGSLKAAEELYKQDPSLLETLDNEGKLPLEMAATEGNTDVATFLENCTATTAATKNTTDGGDEGIRKRK
mmetsp:Transcript_35706/g.39799  ORF Transcript_35706/g.39799 Transcript_35706/m.39799 type:complete len:387 (+) Transcript_35706:116-1276(+)